MKKMVNVFIICALLLTVTQTCSGGNMLSVGTQAPDFTLLTEKGNAVHLTDLRGKNAVVLVFYPGDQTPGCTKQLCSIRDDFSKFEQKGAIVFGVNPGDKKSHTAFIEKQKYQFSLLVDNGQKVATLYGANGLMVHRTVYVIDKMGIIAFAQRGTPTDADILAAIDNK